MTTYYVDPAGSDSSAGTSQGSPWKTPSKVTLFSAATGFAAGDSILFKSGAVHVPAATGENIVLTQSGSRGNEITIGAYGDGDHPILLLGNAPVTPWTIFSAALNIWYNSYAGSVVSNIWEDGYFMRHASSIDTMLPGEYYWNSSSNSYYSLDSSRAVGIYVRPLEGVAGDHVYQRNNTTTGISLSNRSHIWVRDVQLMSGYTAVYANGTTAAHENLRVMDCIVRECRSALQFDSTNGFHQYDCMFLRNVIEDCGHGCGIENSTAGGGTEQAIGCVFSGNETRRIHVVDKWSRIGAFLDKEGFFFMNPKGCSIESNLFEGPGGMAGGAMGLWTDDSSATFEGTTVTGNRVYGISGRVMSLGGANQSNNGGIYVVGNITVDCDADVAIKLNVSPGSLGGYVANNTIINCGDLTVWAQTNVTGWVIRNNIFIRADGTHLQLDSGASVTKSNNHWYGGTAPSLGTAESTADPKIAKDGSPQAGSPVIGAGLQTPGILMRSMSGKHIDGAVDIGARQYHAPRSLATGRTRASRTAASRSAASNR